MIGKGLLKGLVVVLLLCSAVAAFAGVPQTISYQGYLKAGAVPATGPVNITFSIYSSPSAAESLWTETHTNIALENGIYSVQLGSVNAFTLTFDTPYWLGIAVGTEAEQIPRLPLTSVPYAVNAANAERLSLMCTPGDFLHCYTGNTAQMGTGQCRSGNRFCLPTRDGFSAACAGEILPAQELCDNLDNDCDGVIDNKVSPQECYTGPPGTLNVGTCVGGQQTCSAGQWGSCTGQVVPVTEICDNKDNDCNGVVDSFSSPCYSGPVGTQGVGICKAGTKTCTSGVYGSCLGETLPTAEVCGNAVDDNCNGLTDEENATGCTIYRKDADQDGYGISTDTKCLCAPVVPYTASNSGPSDCNDNNALINPGRTEICSNSIDDNCNAQVDEPGASGCTIYYQDVDRDGYGTTASQCLCAPAAPYDSLYSTDCNDSNSAIHPGATEVCDGIDNNCNTLTDTSDLPLSTLCPNTAHAVSSCGGASGCGISFCNTSWYDVDGLYSTGCEAQEDSYDQASQGDLCATSVALGPLVSGQPVNFVANSVPNGDVDWYTATATGITRFDVRFTVNPGSAYRFDLYQTNCSTLLASAVSTNYLATTPATYYIKVYRSIGASAENYVMSVSNGVY